MREVRTVGALMLAAILGMGIARADDRLSWEWGDTTVSFAGVATAGVAMRVEARSDDLIGKTDIPGQQTLCSADDCMSLTGDPGPNARLVKARGAFAGVNGDNGNLNYDRYDVVSAVTRFLPTFRFEHGDFSGKVRGLLFYDPVNADFRETHVNTLYQPARTSRRNGIGRRFAEDFQLREAFVHYEGDTYNVTLGNQIITWGESVLTQFNGVNVINPFDANLARMPGAEVSEYVQPVPAFTVGFELGEGMSADVFYQLAWVPLKPDATGSFFSTSNVLGGGDYVLVGLGQFSQDPDRQYQPTGLTRLISSSTRTAYLKGANKPRDGGQFGGQLRYYADDLNDGTEFGLYYLHYHSRVPGLSAISADPSCTREAMPGSLVESLVACLGFNGTINPVPGREPLPVDTLRPYLDYAQDIDLIGASFNTTAFHWSVAGELAYRPNLPLQIAVSDLIFAAESPAFPAEDIPIPVDALGDNAPLTIPGHRTAVPDFISGYRGITIGPNERIRGYARFHVAQVALLGLRQFSATENPFGADSMLVAIEAGAQRIFGLPSLGRLQLEGAGDRTHHSPGADGSGDPAGQTNSLRINPTQQTGGFATRWSYGWRGLMRLVYNHAIGDANLLPALIWFHDLGGISPASTPNYLSGRVVLFSSVDLELTRDLRVTLQHQLYDGAGRRNLLEDRDNLALSVSYSF